MHTTYIAGATIQYTYSPGCKASQDHFTGNYQPAEDPYIDIQSIETGDVLTFLAAMGGDDIIERLQEKIMLEPHN